jgi:hypothetical protein
MSTTSHQKLILWIFILLKFILVYVLVHPVYELHRDEYLHLDLGRHLSWGYTSVPPATGLLSYLILLLGNSVFWVKFFPALLGALTTWVVWMIVRHLRGGTFALLLACAATTLSVIMRINILYQPNSLDILSWTLVYFGLIKYIDSNDRRWIWLTGVFFAIGFLNKYNIGFLALGLLPGLLLSEKRDLFLKKDFYFAVLIAFILILPNLIWQYQNHFPVVHHMKELSETQLVNVARMDFVKEQIFFFIGSLFVLLAASIAFIIYPAFKRFRFIVLSFVFTIAVFVFFKAKAYYAIGLYPVLLAFGSVYLEQLLRTGWRHYLRPVAILIPILFYIPVVRDSLPIYTPQHLEKTALRSGKYHTWEDGKKHALQQDFADMLGWKELAAQVDAAYSSVQDKQHTLIMADNYGQAGAINYYTKIKGLQANSFNADYIYWMKLNEPITTFISIKTAAEPDEELIIEKRVFGKYRLVGEVKNKYAREHGTKIYILTEPKVAINNALRMYRERLLKADGF